MINIAIIGMGGRGRATLERLGDIPEAKVVCLCDKNRHCDSLPSEIPFLSDWHAVISMPEVQLLYVCTPWDSHVEIATEAMRRGKHVALEIPAAITVADCELLVRTSLHTARQCIMLENCCYDTWHLGIREIVRQGLLGEIVRLEGAYIHPVASDWMIGLRRKMQGNPYPTHGLGPMCQLLRSDDRMEYLISMDAHNHGTGDNVNDTLIHTRRGVTMLLQYDTSTPRPYNRLQTVCGTKGFAQKYPVPCLQLNDTEGKGESLLLQGKEAEQYVEDHIPATFKQLIREGQARGVKNVMNYMMDRRLLQAIEEDIQADTGVREAALWSCFTELTERSAQREGAKVCIPQF